MLFDAATLVNFEFDQKVYTLVDGLFTFMHLSRIVISITVCIPCINLWTFYLRASSHWIAWIPYGGPLIRWRKKSWKLPHGILVGFDNILGNKNSVHSIEHFVCYAWINNIYATEMHENEYKNFALRFYDLWTSGINQNCRMNIKQKTIKALSVLHL